MVVLTSLWPSNCRTVRMSVPVWRRRVENARRNAYDAAEKYAYAHQGRLEGTMKVLVIEVGRRWTPVREHTDWSVCGRTDN